VGDCQYFGVAEAERFALFGRRVDVHGRAGAAALAVDELALLAAKPATQHASVARVEGRLVDVELVGVDLALDDALAQAPYAGDEHDVAEAGLRVEGEGDAAGGKV